LKVGNDRPIVSVRGGGAGGGLEKVRANLLNIVVVLVQIVPYNCSETD